jgi:hypothetical protein
MRTTRPSPGRLLAPACAGLLLAGASVHADPPRCREFRTEETCRAQHPDCRWGGPTFGCRDI